MSGANEEIELAVASALFRCQDIKESIKRTVGTMADMRGAVSVALKKIDDEDTQGDEAENVESAANSRAKKLTWDKEFDFYACWRVLKDQPKWSISATQGKLGPFQSSVS